MFKQIVDGRTDSDGRRTNQYQKSSPWHFVPGELIKCTTKTTFLYTEHLFKHGVNLNSLNILKISQNNKTAIIVVSTKVDTIYRKLFDITDSVHT